jgi:molybdopterin converting factor subunit 1
MTTVNVRLFAGLREMIGKPSIDVELPEGATVATLKERIEQEYPLVRALSSSLVCAINEEYVPGDRPIRAGDDIALIPPVSGGAPVIQGAAKNLNVDPPAGAGES